MKVQTISKSNSAILSENPLLRYFNFIILYFAQGVPEGMLLYGIPAWMAMNHKSPGEIATFAVACGLPWSLKFILAPMMDRYTYLPMGRKRPWVILGQLGLVGSFINLAFVPDPLNNLNQLMIAGFLVSLFGAFQDVAVDGMAIDIIPDNQQARANGFMWGSKITGISISLAIGSWLLNKYNFTTSILVLSATIAVIMIVPILMRERAGEKLLPFTNGQASAESKKLQVDNWKLLFKSLFQVFKLRNSLILTIMLFVMQGAFNYMGTLLPIFTVKELGWTNVIYSENYAMAKLIGGIVGMIFGGILIERFGKRNMMNIYLILLIIATGILAFSSNFWTSTTAIYSYMMFYNILVTFATIGIFAIAMQCCWKKVSASQFTLYMTLGNLGRIVIAGLIGPISGHFTWHISIFSFGIFLMIALIAFQFLSVTGQIKKIAELEQKDLDASVLKMAADSNI